MNESIMAKIITDRGSNRYSVYSVPQVGDELCILEGDGSETLIQVTKVRHLADRSGDFMNHPHISLRLVIWGKELEDDNPSSSFI
ncbi:hypothetical protein NIES4106_61470 (plasmid) [Fischerella sp. NIES-4106]|nr:hypothetical protein NIES4106_61470 [Fischerella sp. NIES-4106]